VAPEHRAFVLLTAAASAVLLLWAALAAGSDHRVRTFRAVTLLGGATLPLAAIRAVATPYRAPLGGAALLAVAVTGVLHRALAGRRRTGPAERAIRTLRLVLEGAGLALLAAVVVLLLRDLPVPVRLAFWSLFLLRLSIADLLDPSRLAGRTGLTQSAARDFRAGARPSRRPVPSRLARVTRGLAKSALYVLWLALPLAAALAPGEVAAGSWPREALALRFYPPAALGLTALLLVGQGSARLARRPGDAFRGLLAGLGTGLYLTALFALPSFAAYRASLGGLYLAETVTGFLLGTVSKRA